MKFPIPFAIVWTTFSAQADILLTEDFTGGDGGFISTEVGGSTFPWTLNVPSSSWRLDGDTDLGSPTRNNLTSPIIDVTGTEALIISFDHRYSIEGGLWDGGALFTSLNGGEFVQVPATAFVENGYTAMGLIGNHDLFEGDGFGGDSPGYASETFITSVAEIPGMAIGDTIQLQFVGAYDEFSRGTFLPNWEIDRVTVETQVDTDGDGMPNNYERANGLDPDVDDADGDLDSDNVSNLTEFENGTDPQDEDSDDDNLNDGVETNTGIFLSSGDTGTDPLNDDSDSDGLSDGVENPDLPYVDADQTGSDPNIVDTDGDGLDDPYEIANSLNPGDDGTADPVNGADGDPDMDTLSNIEERDLGTDPQDDDTDMDSLSDGVETNTGTWVSATDTGTDPLDNDSDNDGLLDGVENPDLPYDSGNPTTQPGTDPNNADSDGDSVRDGVEVAEGRNPTVPQALPSGYVQNFDGFADGATDLGDGSVMNGTAAVEGDQLVLTRDGVGGGFASFMIPAIEGSENGWTASFDLTITDGPGANEPADGFSFNYGNFTLDELGGAEEGMAAIGSVTENISFEVDTWMNLDAEQGVNIAEKIDGLDTDLSFTNGSILADGTSVSGPVTIIYDPEEGLSFTTEGLLTNAEFENIATSFLGDAEYNFGFSARVGGANQTVAIDNLQIFLGSAPQDNFRIISIEMDDSVPGAVEMTTTSFTDRGYRLESCVGSTTFATPHNNSARRLHRRSIGWDQKVCRH